MRRFDDTRVMVRAELGDLAPAALPPGMSIQAIGLEPFAQCVGQLRGSPPGERQAHAQRLLQSPVPFRAFELRVDGELAACGQFAVEHDLAGLYDVFTAHPARGRGLARLLCSNMLGQAQAEGARHAYLQVEGDNHAARAVYRRLGFADGYAYHYRTRDAQAA
jgi:ribosomal protein S18 acetylase RimI-like enzyme